MAVAEASTPQVHDIEMPTGHYLNVADPSGADIRIEDIAHKLAQINRFGGATYYPYPVAQHALFVAIRLRNTGATLEEQFAGLHHDDAEYITTDIQKPIKLYLGADDKLSDMEDAWQHEIEKRLGIASYDKALIKSADTFAVLVEAKNLLPSKGRNWRARPAQQQWKLLGGKLPEQLRTPNYWRGELHWSQARDEWLTHHYLLREALDAKDN